MCEGDRIEADDLQIRSPSSAEQSVNPEAVSLDPYLGDIEKASILRALEQTRHNKTAAARLLGISFGALRYRLKKLGLE